MPLGHVVKRQGTNHEGIPLASLRRDDGKSRGEPDTKHSAQLQITHVPPAPSSLRAVQATKLGMGSPVPVVEELPETDLESVCAPLPCEASAERATSMTNQQGKPPNPRRKGGTKLPPNNRFEVRVPQAVPRNEEPGKKSEPLAVELRRSVAAVQPASTRSTTPPPFSSPARAGNNNAEDHHEDEHDPEADLATQVLRDPEDELVTNILTSRRTLGPNSLPSNPPPALQPPTRRTTSVAPPSKRASLWPALDSRLPPPASVPNGLGQGSSRPPSVRLSSSKPPSASREIFEEQRERMLNTIAGEGGVEEINRQAILLATEMRESDLAKLAEQLEHWLTKLDANNPAHVPRLIKIYSALGIIRGRCIQVRRTLSSVSQLPQAPLLQPVAEAQTTSASVASKEALRETSGKTEMLRRRKLMNVFMYAANAIAFICIISIKTRPASSAFIPAILIVLALLVVTVILQKTSVGNWGRAAYAGCVIVSFLALLATFQFHLF